MIRRISTAAIIIGVLFLIYGAAVTALYGAGTPMLWAWYAVGAVLTANGITGLRSSKRGIAVTSLVINIAAAVFLSGGAVFSLLALSEMEKEPEPGCEYVIILGAAVNGDAPSEALQKRIDAAKSQLAPTTEELYPNMKFGENKFAMQLEENKQLTDFITNPKQ